MKNRIKILAPLYAAHEVEPLAASGASEIYCGVMEVEGPMSYAKRFNARFLHLANLGSFAELKSVVARAHRQGMRVLFTVNDFFAPKQYERVLSHIRQAVAAEVDALIIADLGLAADLMERYQGFGKEIHISSRVPIFNANALNFFKSLRASRVVIPPNLTVAEMQPLCHQGIDLEVFILNQRCSNVQAFCRCPHGSFLTHVAHRFHKLYDFSPLRRSGVFWRQSRLINYRLEKFVNALFARQKSKYCFCRNEFECRVYDRNDRLVDAAGKARRLWDPVSHFTYSCGACFLYRFTEMGIGHVKVVGRIDPTVKKIRDVKFIKDLLDYIEQGCTEDQFMAQARGLRRQVYGAQACDPANCTYQMD